VKRKGEPQGKDLYRRERRMKRMGVQRAKKEQVMALIEKFGGKRK
jgi:hypothetical protein